MVSVWVQFSLILYIISNFILLSQPEKIRENLFKNGPCLRSEFRCLNDACIPKYSHCDGQNDCEDNSDEQYCTTWSCPTLHSFESCENGRYIKCYPSSWHCDGYNDCTNNQDENNCENYEFPGLHLTQFTKARDSVKMWLTDQRHFQWPLQKWGSEISRVAVLSYFLQDSSTKQNFLSDETLRDEIMYELSLNFLSKLALIRLQGISTFELASHINAFLVTCIDPRQFHMFDLVQELRLRVDTQNFTDPFALLTLCNAQEFITVKYIGMLQNEFWNANREFQTEMQAMIILALSCASNQPESEVNRTELYDMTLELKTLQHPNGTVDNLKTTALVMQAILAADSEPDHENFNETAAFRAILASQGTDGSFWDFTTTYYVAPVLQFSSLANINSTHCENLANVENNRLQYLKKYTHLKKNVTYSLWFGEDQFVQRTLKFQVPINSSFYTIMEYAAELDEEYKFKYNIREGKPHIFAISKVMNDPEKQLFWRPYFETLEFDKKLKLIPNSPSEVIPENNVHLIYWYRKFKFN